MEKKSFIKGGLLADSAALGSHWIYKPAKILELFENFDSLSKPYEDSFHKTGVLGGQTHYGDQTIWLLESCATAGRFSLDVFREVWLKHMEEYTGYCDGSMTKSLPLLKKGSSVGAESHDLSSSSRAIITMALAEGESERLETCFSEMELTHTGESLREAVTLFCEIYAELEGGNLSLCEATHRVLEKTSVEWIKESYAAVLEKSEEKDVTKVVAELGSACSMPKSFASTLYLFLYDFQDYKSATVANLYAGGDSAARGTLLGAFWAGIEGEESLPSAWLDQWLARERVEQYLGQLKI